MDWFGTLHFVAVRLAMAVLVGFVQERYGQSWCGGLGPVGSGTVSRGEFSHGGSGRLRLVKSPFGWAC